MKRRDSLKTPGGGKERELALVCKVKKDKKDSRRRECWGEGGAKTNRETTPGDVEIQPFSLPGAPGALQGPDFLILKGLRLPPRSAGEG